MKAENNINYVEETLTILGRNIAELRAKISKASKELNLEDSRYGTKFVGEASIKLKKMRKYIDSKYKELLAEFSKDLKELKILAGKVSAEIFSKSIDFTTKRGKFFLKLLFQRGRQKNNNISESDLRSVLESVETILFSMYGQDGMNYKRLSFMRSNVLLVVTLLGLCIAHAVLVFDSKARKINRITSKSGATMYFILGRSKLFSSEVFGEALVMSLLISEQNGSDEQRSIQIAYTLLFPNDCRMFLYIPIYLNGYVFRTEHKNNTIPIVPILCERHTDGALNMPNDPGWHGVIINK